MTVSEHCTGGINHSATDIRYMPTQTIAENIPLSATAEVLRADLKTLPRAVRFRFRCVVL